MNGRFAGPYQFDEAMGTVTGCPARAPVVVKTLKAIKTKSRMKGASATRQHAEAMTMEELTYAMEWSEAQCPVSLLGTPVDAKDTKRQYHIVRHSLLRALFSTGFTLWTRCVTLTALAHLK